MRKVLVVALREYNAAVRTRAFLIGLLVMPLLMGGSVILQWALKDYRDTKPRKIVIVDRSPGGVLLDALTSAVESYNDNQTIDPESNQRIRPPFELETLGPPADRPDEVASFRKEQSSRVRRGQVTGFLEIGPETARLDLSEDPSRAVVRYESNRPTDQEFVQLARSVLAVKVRQLRAREAGLDPARVEKVSRLVPIETRWEATLVVPIVLMVLMYLLILTAATPLMQGVVEEKMQRIAEVLLGSVQPFQLMLGKLVGMTGVSLTMAAVYLSGAYWAAHSYGLADSAPWSLLVWFGVFQTLAALMYGALFIAVGAACTDMRETQNLLWPVMLLATFPMFVLGNVIREPNSAVVTGLSFFPFATPSLMIARQGMPPGVPWWQPAVGAAGMLVTTLICVWMAGRIFRVGILLMGKGAGLGEMARWVFRG